MFRYEPSDQRIVCGVNCTWWDGVEKTTPIPGAHGKLGQPLPGCPHCHGPLFQIANPGVWWAKTRAYEADSHPGYAEFVSWLKGKCFPTMDTAKLVYELRYGRKVVL